MDELVNLVAEKTGISQDQARQAVVTVVGFIKEKLPEPIASQVDGFINGSGSDEVVKQAAGLLGGLFDKK